MRKPVFLHLYSGYKFMKASFKIALLLLFLSLCFLDARGTHIVGGEMTYQYLGDTAISLSIYHKYKVSLSIYEDCINGNLEAIAEDNPAYFGVFGPTYVNIDSSYFSSAISVPTNFSNSCVTNVPATCLIKKTFIKNYYLPINSTGYVVTYQRCCRNSVILNIVRPGEKGSTYSCYIPPAPYNNNSAVFKNYPPQIICLNNPLIYDNSATDADGDSLSYGFIAALDGADDPANSKPLPSPPPYDSVQYISPPFNSQNPISGYPAIHINPLTGLITGTPNRLGRYLVAVYCNEYRNGVLINTIVREFQFVVTDCSKTVIADIPQYSTDPNTFIVDCTDYTVHFVNTSSGGFAYHWDFGIPGATGDTSNQFQPVFTYPDTGTFSVKLVVNPSTTCPDSITRFVKIYPKFVASFSDSGRFCPGVPISFTDLSTATIKPITFWKWVFGDGDSSFTENPAHIYQYGGTYNVILMSQNIKDCADTVVRQIVVDNFKPFAGNDTVIVKGETVQFNAVGGLEYAWSPENNLSNDSINNPIGYFPDTGHFSYYVHVTSAYGCAGDDTIQVIVVSQSTFLVPSAFTPNGDGRNDYFRPIAVGFRGLNYFKVYNRWGQEVYYSKSFETGWDGTFNNKKADLGTYFWEISFTDRFGKDGFLKGDVELLR